MIVRLIIGALMIGAVYSVVGIGYSVIYRASGLMSLCQGDMLMFGAFLGLFFNKSLGLPFPIALLFTTVLMFLLGMGIQKFLVIPLLKKASGFASVILCTLALSYVLQNTALIGWGSRMFQFPSIFKTNSINIFGIGVAPENALVLGAAILVMIILHLFMTKTKFGTAMRAAALDETAASAVGINVGVTKGVAWGIASGLAGAIGCLLGPVYGVYTTMGILIGQKGFAGAVSGGYGNMYGAIIGGMFFGFAETFISAYISTSYKDCISFGILIIILTFMPTGILKSKVLE